MEDTPGEAFAARWRTLRARVDAACRAAGRDPGEVAILPVSKTFPAARVREAAGLGLRRFGESRVQEVRDKAATLADLDLEWVLIGHLQTNKARDVARLAHEVQSLDRPELAEALDRRLQTEGRGIDVLVQVKTAREPSKHGLDADELLPFLGRLRSFDTLRVRGLMTMAEFTDDSAVVRDCFRRLRELRGHARDAGHDLPRLSMGMSGDFALAIAEGSTEVRIGSALFGARPPLQAD